MKPRLDHPDQNFPPHYAITSPHRLVSGPGVIDEHGDEKSTSFIALDVEAITTILAAHMAAFVRDEKEMDIGGYKLSSRAVARIYIDAMGTFLRAHGITENLPLIERELCADCLKKKET